MNKSGDKRFSVSLPDDLNRRVAAFAVSSSCSKSRAISELLRLGLDADTAGVETALHVQSQVKRELNSLRGLVVEAINAADTACSLSLALAVKNELIGRQEVSHLYSSARDLAKSKIKKMKKVAGSSPTYSTDSELLEGLEE